MTNKQKAGGAEGRMQRLVGPALDAAVLDTLKHQTRMTYVVTNVLRMDLRVPIKTDAVRRALMRLERAGKVKRCRSNYATQICWSLVPPNDRINRPEKAKEE